MTKKDKQHTRPVGIQCNDLPSVILNVRVISTLIYRWPGVSTAVSDAQDVPEFSFRRVHFTAPFTNILQYCQDHRDFLLFLVSGY